MALPRQPPCFVGKRAMLISVGMLNQLVSFQGVVNPQRGRYGALKLEPCLTADAPYAFDDKKMLIIIFRCKSSKSKPSAYSDGILSGGVILLATYQIYRHNGKIH